MPASLHVSWDETFLSYDFGPRHPMSPVRADLTMRLARELGVLDLPGVVLVAAEPADDALLTTVHAPAYVEAVRHAGRAPHDADHACGLGTSDTPAFRGMHEVGAAIVGASVQCAEQVWSGRSAHAVNIAGGLHHAMRDRASGFCVYNDAAAAVARLLALGARRVAYVDVDVHHGDGVESIFWDDPRVLTISLHESGRTLFPGTGAPTDTGGPGAAGSAVNVALPRGTGDAGWLRAFHAVVPPLLEAFEPDVLVTQQGCDTHDADPLGHLRLSVDGQRASYAALHALAHRHANGRWVALGGGGYAVVDVVPRAWSHLLAEAADAPLAADAPVPGEWRDYVAHALGCPAPVSMGDGALAEYAAYGEPGPNGETLVDEAIAATRAAVFPMHGLAPR